MKTLFFCNFGEEKCHSQLFSVCPNSASTLGFSKCVMHLVNTYSGQFKTAKKMGMKLDTLHFFIFCKIGRLETLESIVLSSRQKVRVVHIYMKKMLKFQKWPLDDTVIQILIWIAFILV